MKAEAGKRVLLVLLFLLPLAVDFPVLRAGFAFDDLHSISRNPHIRGIENIPRFFTDPTCFSGIPKNAMYRPFLLVTYSLDYAVAGLSPWFWHLTNLLLHGAVGLLVFFLLKRFLVMETGRETGGPGLQGGLPEGWGGGGGRSRWLGKGEAAAYVGAVFFLAHPLNVEVLGHVSSRSDLLMGFLLLGALLTACRAVEKRGGKVRFGAFLAAQALLAAALLTKEPSVLFPVAALPFLVLAQAAGERPLGARLRRAGAVLLPGLFLTVGYLVLRKHLLGTAAASLPGWTGGNDPLAGGGRDMATQLFTQALALGKAVEVILFPWKLSADHWIPFQHGFLEGPVLWGLLLWSLFTGGLFVFSSPRRPALAGLAWAAVLMAPAILVPLNQVFAEHRLYAAGPGLALALTAAILGISRRLKHWVLPGWTGAPVLVLAFLLLGCRSYLRSLDWRDRETLWKATIATDPKSYRAWAQLGQALGEKGDEEGALACFRRAHELYPASPGLAVNLVEYLVRAGTRREDASLCREALDVARRQVRRTPWKALPRVKLCRCLLALSVLEEDPVLAGSAVEAAASILSFTAPLDRTWAVWAASLDAVGEGDAARVLWKWGDKVLAEVGPQARKARAHLLVRLGRPGEAWETLRPLLMRKVQDPEVRDLVERIRISGTSPGGSSGSPGASPPRRSP